MQAIDVHVHWFPTQYYEFLASRKGDPQVTRLNDGWWQYTSGSRRYRHWPEWFDLEQQFETQALTGMETAVVSSMGVHSDLDGLPASEASEAARLINETWSDAQRRYPGRFFAAAAVPLQDTQMAIDELDYAIQRLDLRGVSIPASISGSPIANERLEPFYARVAELEVPMFIHPTDSAVVDADVFSGHDGALVRTVGRVVDSSVGVLRLVFSGVFDRHPNLKLVHFHAGGILPFTAGRIEKNSRVKELQEPPTEYLKRMWVDTAMPYMPAIAMALEFYGPDRVLYGSDNPCWTPIAALDATKALGLDEAGMNKILIENCNGLIDLRQPVG